MPPTTIVSEVSDTAMPDSVKAGDELKSRVIDEDGEMILTGVTLAG